MTITYRLKDRALQEKLDELTDGDFSKGLAEAVRSTPTGSPHVCVGCGATINPHAPEHLHIPRAYFYFMKDEIEAVPVYDHHTWNNYPEVKPPEALWMRLEFTSGGVRHGRRMMFVCGEWGYGFGTISDLPADASAVRFRPWDEGDTY